MNFTVDGARVLDLFAGTGAMGLEAVSRGARFCQFVDDSAEARGLIPAECRCAGRHRAREESGGAMQPGWALRAAAGIRSRLRPIRPMAKDWKQGACLARRWRLGPAARGCRRRGGIGGGAAGARLDDPAQPARLWRDAGKILSDGSSSLSRAGKAEG